MSESFELPMNAKLVSFLGLGRFDRERQQYVYDPTIYAWGERRADITPYLCRALAQLLRPAEIVVLATEEAERAHSGCLKAALGEDFPQPRFVRIPIGQDRDELWRLFDVVNNELREAGASVVLDITHGFRSSPFFAAAVASFVRAVDINPPDLRTCYAAFEARREGVTPVWELTPFVELVDWTQDIMLFLRTGRSAGVAERTEALGRRFARESRGMGPGPALRGLAATLRDFGGNLETVRTGDLLLPGFAGSAARLAAALREAGRSAAAMPPLADVLDRLQRDMVEPLLGASDHLANEAGHRALAGLARLYLDMGRWAEAAAIVREGWITCYATPAAAFGERNQQRPSVDEEVRDAVETRWNGEERDAARTIAAVRNDIEHAGFKRQPKRAADLQRDLSKLVAEFSELSGVAPPVGAAAHPPVFINLSNHPSNGWGPAQREAALRLAPEIRDWPFPTVPPDAGPAEIAELAERVAEQLRNSCPGATHAMVQGEFTLVHALVRKLQQRGIVCLSATTRRDVIEADGDVKTTRFEFVRFREYL